MDRSAPVPWATGVRKWVPRWWAGNMGVPGRVLDMALWPAEFAYRIAVRARNTAYNRGWAAVSRAHIPVISIGNIGVGGAGKTPFAAWISGRLQASGHSPAIVLRGYGTDEILVHRELNPAIPVFADPRRSAAVEAAASAGCTVAILDDGFQHRAMARDLDLLLISVDSWTATRRLLPRGPWREGDAAFQRAHVIVLTNKSSSVEKCRAVRREVAASAGTRPIVECSIAPSGFSPLHDAGAMIPAYRFRDCSIVAIASLADPQPFANNLRDAGALVELIAFPDHHDFTALEASSILNRAAGRPIIMTHKEAVKLRDLLPGGTSAFVLHQRVDIESGADLLETALQNAVAARR
jgi:tetraacyldisaccharide 4'-kinase